MEARQAIGNAVIPRAPHLTLYEVFLVKRKICVVSGRGRRVGVGFEARSCPSKPCRWPDACQGQSRRRRWPKASLYKRLASDNDRRPRSVGRDYAHLSRLIFRPSHARKDKGRRSSTSRAPSSRRTWACAPSLSGDFRLTTRLVSRVGWRLTMMSGARGAAIGSARRKSRRGLCRERPIIAPQPCIRRALRPNP